MSLLSARLSSERASASGQVASPTSLPRTWDGQRGRAETLAEPLARQHGEQRTNGGVLRRWHEAAVRLMPQSARQNKTCHATRPGSRLRKLRFPDRVPGASRTGLGGLARNV